MRRLRPEPAADVDAYDLYRPADPSAPLLRLNMVASLDGRITDRAGRSGGLGGAADRRVFRALRALADAVLVGAGTARVEGYGPHVVDPSIEGRRRADGRAHPAAVVLVSGSLDLDPTSRVFSQALTPTIVLTCASASADRRARLAEVAEVEVVGQTGVDLEAGLARLRARGLAHVLCEGGPSLNTALLRAGLVDELCLTLAPQMVGGADTRIASVEAAVGARLAGIACDADELFLRYEVDRG